MLSIFGCKKKTEEEQFWNWFKKNESMLFKFNDNNMDIAFNKLGKELGKELNRIHEDLTFEFSPVLDNGKKEFIISASGMKDAFPKVESLYNSAPSLGNWIFIKYRPRRKPMDISMNNKTFKVEDIKCQIFKDGDKLGVMVFFEDYNESESSLFGQVGFLLLDQAIGEYDVATRLGFIEFAPMDSKYVKEAFLFSELTERFDEFYQK